MSGTRVAGVVIRLIRLERNWSQETLCHGICAVSYLSKIEQGKVDVNPLLLEDIFARLGVKWRESAQITALRDALYEGIFAWDVTYTRQQIGVLEEKWDQWLVGPCYADFTVIRAYHHNKPEWIPKELEPLLDSRQRALFALAHGRHDEAFRIYPCPLTAFCIGEEAFQQGNYTLALEYLQIAFDQAAREGYVYLSMYSRHYMANCCSDMGNLDAMHRHSAVAARLGRALGQDELIRTVDYNIAAAKAEMGNFEESYAYFYSLTKYSVMDLHKLAVCCEALGKKEEAIAALDRAGDIDCVYPLEREMCALVRYRLEHPDYLHDPAYGELLMTTFEQIRQTLHFGFARFHLRWVIQWLTANRRYRQAFEIIQSFPEKANLTMF